MIISMMGISTQLMHFWGLIAERTSKPSSHCPEAAQQPASA